MINISMSLPEILSITGTVAIASLYAFSQWRSNSSKVSSEVMAYYKEQANIHTAQISKLQQELGVIKGENVEKDKRIELLTKIVENRNPEMEAFMRTMLAAASNSEKYIENSTKILGQIGTFMVKMEPALTQIASK